MEQQESGSGDLTAIDPVVEGASAPTVESLRRVEVRTLGERVAATLAILDDAPNAVMALSREWRYAYINEAAAQQVGKTRAELEGRVIWEVFPEAVGGTFWDAYHRAMAGEVVEAQDQYAPLDLWFEVRAYPIEHGIAVHFSDVTARERTARALERSRRQSAQAERIAHLGSWELDLATSELNWSDEIYRIFEIDREGFGASYEAFLNVIHPDDREPVDLAYRRSVEDRTSYEIVHRLLMRDGRIKHVRERGETEYAEDGSALRSRGTVQDVTDQVLAERMMAEKDAAIESSISAIAIADIDGRVKYVNSAFAELWGLPDPSEAVGRLAQEFVVNPDEAIAVISALVENRPWLGRMVARRADGKAIPVQIAAQPIRDRNGTILGTMASFVDRTADEEAARRVAEALAQVAESEALYRAAFDQTAVGMIVADLDGRIERTNEIAGTILGRSPEELAGMPFERFLPAGDRSGFQERLAALASGVSRTYARETRILRLDGSVAWIFGAASVLQTKGSPDRIVIFFHDATAEHEAISALRRSEAGLRRAEALALLGSWEWNPETGESRWSDALYVIYGLPPDLGPRAAEQFLDIVVESDRPGVSAAMEEMVRHGASKIEFRIRRGDGAIRLIRAEAALADAKAESAFRIYGVVQDITEQRASEQRLAASLREKEVLLREIHHRVKNNLQVISSLLYFPAAAIDDPAVAAVFTESRDRVHAMALIHETLYQSADLARIDFAAYARQLADGLAASYADPRRLIRIASEVGAVPLDIAQAVPCGLIISELVTNALKHAFAGRAAGTITIGLGPVEPGALRLSVRDDGVGITDERAASTTTLGLRLVRALVEQLEGTLEIRSQGGATFAVTFPAVRAGGEEG